MKNTKLKIIINTSDIVRIENCSNRTACQRLNDIKLYYKKYEKRKKITFKEYATYTGISLEELEPFRY
jgi:hypothetical protein